MSADALETELQKFNVSEAAISEMAARYLPLVIKDIDDAEGQRLVKEARNDVRKKRTSVDKKRKELTADALELQRRINGAAKKVLSLLEPIENHLIAEEKKITDKLERLKVLREQQESLRYNQRVEKLLMLSFKFDGIKFITDYHDTFDDIPLQIAVLHVKQFTEVQFNEFLDNAKHYFDVEQKRLAAEALGLKVKLEAEQAARDAEDARLKAEREVIAQQRKELEAEKRIQAQKAAELKAQEDALNKPTVVAHHNGVDQLTAEIFLTKPSEIAKATKPIKKQEINYFECDGQIFITKDFFDFALSEAGCEFTVEEYAMLEKLTNDWIRNARERIIDDCIQDVLSDRSKNTNMNSEFAP